MGEVVLSLWAFILYTIICISFGFFVLSILAMSSKADDQNERIISNYQLQWIAITNSVLTQEQKLKIDKMMEEKDEN